MFRQKRINDFSDYFLPLSKRTEKTVYFTRFRGISDEVQIFLKKYYDIARKNGVIIDGKIPNPSIKNLEYYYEIMGKTFILDLKFILKQLEKWLPRMTMLQRELIGAALFSILKDMLKDGKSETVVKNSYIKHMCWLYYKFERIVSNLGTENLPKIIYCGDINYNELQMLCILSNAGADIVLLDCGTSNNHLILDLENRYSYLYQTENLKPFFSGFNLKWIQDEIIKTGNKKRLSEDLPTIKNCTNSWVEEKKLESILLDVNKRGNDNFLFYNCFIQQFGAMNKINYLNELQLFYKKIQESKRNICVVNKCIPTPTLKEISNIKRKSYNTVDDLIIDLKQNFKNISNLELKRLVTASFVETLLDEQEKNKFPIRKLTNYAVYLLCWLQRYQNELFLNWKQSDISIFILFGNCETECEAVFLRLLSKLPVDVLVLIPNMNSVSKLDTHEVIEIRYTESASIEYFPNDNKELWLETVAYQAERELDYLIYQDSGLYRNYQFSKAETILLKTMYEEISIIWDQELKFRPGFSVHKQTVVLPIIFTKISGVKNGNVNNYWSEIKQFVTQDTIMKANTSYISSSDRNIITSDKAIQFLQNKKLVREKIKNHKDYCYGILREEMQEYLLDKLQSLLDQKIIKGTYENGMEYKIISTVLNLNQELLRMIQKFDFTKKNPKFIFIFTKEQILSLEDSILVAFLSLIGFDILFFVPTGYQNIEKHFKNNFIYEQQIGEYMYDLNVPNLSKNNKQNSKFTKTIFSRRRG